MTRRTWAVVLVLIVALADLSARQLGSSPAPEWIKRLERSDRVAGLKIDYVISKLELKPGQVVADIGAGSGLFSLPMAKAVSPGGKVYAVEVDQAFLDYLERKKRDQNVKNVESILGKFTDPRVPARNVDVALLHDTLHHIEDRAGYLKALAPYMNADGRIAVIEMPANGAHKDEPRLIVTKEQVAAWMADAGFKPVQEFEGLSDGKWFVVYARR